MSTHRTPGEQFILLAEESLAENRSLLESLLRKANQLQKERDECIASANRIGHRCMALMVCLGRSDTEARREVVEWRNRWLIG